MQVREGLGEKILLSIDTFVTVLVVTAMLTVETVIAPVFLFYLFIFSIHEILGCTMNADLEYLAIFGCESSPIIRNVR